MSSAIPIGTLVKKNLDTWEVNDFDSWGRGIGIGEVIDPPFDIADLDLVDVRWPAGRCFEKVHGLLIVDSNGQQDEQCAV